MGVVTLPGVTLMARGPNESLVLLLQDLLESAKAGDLQSLIGTGFQADGLRVAVWADAHDDVYQMAGALAWLHHEYMARHSDGGGS